MKKRYVAVLSAIVTAFSPVASFGADESTVSETTVSEEQNQQTDLTE